MLKKQQQEHYFIDEAVSLRINTTIRNNQYKEVVDIYCRGEKFGYLLVAAKNSYQKKEIIPLYVYNTRLYQRGWNTFLIKIVGSLGLAFHSISVLDIALDTVGLNHGFVKMLSGDGLELTCKADPRGKYCDKTKRLRADAGIKLGSDKSNWQFCFYEKSKDYAEKGYIREFHNENGINTDGKVDRCELRLNNSECSKFQLEIEKLEDPNYLIGIFSVYSDAKLSFKNVGSYSYQNNNRIFSKLKLIEFEDAVDKIKKKETSCVTADSIKSTKTAVKQMVIDFATDPNRNKLQYIQAFISKFNLQSWVSRTHQFWFKNLSSEVKANLAVLLNRKRLTELYWYFWRTTAWTSFAWILVAV